MRFSSSRLAVAVLTVLAGTSFARAEDSMDVYRGLPLRVRDTRPSEVGEIEFQLSSTFEQSNEKHGSTSITPQVEYGLTKNFEIELESSFIISNDDRGGSGDLELGGQYRLIEDNGTIPAVAIAGALIAPTGVGSDGLDFELELDLSKGIGGDDAARHHVFLNLIWEHNSIPGDDDRHDVFAGVFGYSFQLDDNTLLLTDFIREQQDDEGADSNIIEAGVVRRVGEHVMIGLGGGVGIGDDSPNYLITAGLQFSL